jgi:hypothetical protein
MKRKGKQLHLGSLVWAHLNKGNRCTMVGFTIKNGFHNMFLLPAMVGVFCCSPARQHTSADSAGTGQTVTWETAAAILDSIKPPVFPDRTYSIKDFGAIADGFSIAQTINTPSYYHNNSGGMDVPAGRYVTGRFTEKQ